MTQPVPERTLGEAAYRVLMPSEATELDEKELGKVRCVIVTPERAVLDAVAELAVRPMFARARRGRAGKADEVRGAKAAEGSAQADAIAGGDQVVRANRQKARQRALAMSRVAGKA